MFHAILDTLKRYSEVSRWLCRDVTRVFWRQLLVIMAARVIGVGCFVAALGVVTFYAKRLEENRAIELLGMSYEPRQSVPLLILTGAVVLVAMLAGAGLNYLSNRRALFLRRDYTTFSCQRVLGLASEAVRFWTPPENESSPERFLMTLAKRDARYCGRVAALIVISIIPAAIALVIAVPALIYINPWLTIIVAVIVGASLVQHYRLSVHTARLSLDRETYVADVSRIYQRFIVESGHQHVPRQATELPQRFREEAMQKYLDAEIGYRVASRKSQFINDFAIGVAVMVILVVLGSTILIRGTGWSALLVYLVAMRYSMGQIRGLMAAVTNSNRFYHQIRRYFLFIENARLTEDVSTAIPPSELVLHLCADRAIEDSQESMTLTPGDRAALLTTMPLNRYALPRMLSTMLDPQKKERKIEHLLVHTAIVTRRSPLLPAESLRESLGMQGDSGLEALQPALAACGLWQPLRDRLPGNAEPPLDHPVPDDLDEELRIALLLISAATRGVRLIMVEATALSAIESERLCQVLDQLRGSIVCIVGRDSEAIGEYDETGIVVLGEEGVIGLGSVDWLRQQRPAVDEALIGSARIEELAAAGAVDDDDDL